MMSLFFKECKQITKSIIYFVFLGVVVIFYVSQLGDYAGSSIKEAKVNAKYSADNPLMKPPADAEGYGQIQVEIPEQVMPGAILSLVPEYIGNYYITYPIGFYKNIKLNEKEQQRIAQIIQEITGQTVEKLQEATDEFNAKKQAGFLAGDAISPDASETIPIQISYEQFKEKMAEIDNILGGGSAYALENLQAYGFAPITYEEKLAEYNAFINEDKITGAFARLFCDYMGIVIALFGIFVPVSVLLRDKKAQCNELIYSRQMGSVRLVFTRYIANVFMMLLPFLLISLIPTIQLIGYGMKENIAVDVLAFLKYSIAWLLPTIMTTTAVGYIFTTLTDTPIAIGIQFLWSFLSIFTGNSNNIGGGHYEWGLIIRHNSLGNLQAMKEEISALMLNRVSYTIFALVLIVITIVIYEQKRRGRIDVGSQLQKIFRRRKSSS